MLIFCSIVVLVGTLNDWHMQRQFNRLNKKNSDRIVKLLRSGKPVEVSVFDIMVGDVMYLQTGDIVPVDGIFISGHSVECDESSATGESEILRKTPAADVSAFLASPDGHDTHKLDPFIISGSKVTQGDGTFLVTAVGVNSSYGRISMSLRTEQEDTPLQKKLNILADWIAKFGAGAALVLFVVLFIKFCVQLPNNTGSPSEKGQDFLSIFIVSVTVVVVAVPEGLPLAVTLALSFATVKMLRDNNLVRVLKACETMGNATTVCSDKTGTLTENKMTVVAMTLGNSLAFGGEASPTLGVKDMDRAGFLASLTPEVKELLIHAAVLNSTAFEGEQDGEQVFIGSKTEVALLDFCRTHLGAGPVQEIRSSAEIIQVLPFSSQLKYSAVVVKLPSGIFRLYVKGASEILLEKCTAVLAGSLSLASAPDTLTDTDRQTLVSTISGYAKQSLRTISSTFRDFESWPPQDAISQGDARLADLSAMHENMTLISIFGIKDPLRPSVIGAIQDCKRAGVFVRMVTGDNIETASAIARECGIYNPDTGGIAMEGPVFRRLSQEELEKTVVNLQVLARSSPEDKRILVRTLKDLGETVAVTGDGTNDAPALKMADIGFSMGIAGTEVAKEASSIILLDDK